MRMPFYTVFIDLNPIRPRPRVVNIWTMHLIEEAFGKGCSLYDDVLKCPKDANKAQLRKAYYRSALQYHPDKNDTAKASQQFQAVSLAYQILLDPDLRSDYDKTGELPSERVVDEATADDNDRAEGADGTAHWKNYFDSIFGKVTVSKLDAFSSKYKCSDEERRDVLKEFQKRKGNLVKMLDFVMLSETRDALRWVEDYIQPAMESGEVAESLKDAMNKSLKQIKKKMEKEAAKAKEEEEDEEDDDDNDDDDEEEVDEDETESEDDNDDEEEQESDRKIGKKNKSRPSSQPNQKRRKTSASNKSNDMSDLVAQIQNKRRANGSALLSSLGARYGVTATDENDPLSDADFAKIQSKFKKRT